MKKIEEKFTSFLVHPINSVWRLKQSIILKHPNSNEFRELQFRDIPRRKKKIYLIPDMELPFQPVTSGKGNIYLTQEFLKEEYNLKLCEEGSNYLLGIMKEIMIADFHSSIVMPIVALANKPISYQNAGGHYLYGSIGKKGGKSLDVAHWSHLFQTDVYWQLLAEKIT